MPAYAPPGWPDQVRPPGVPDWEADAAAFLLDCCPADFRAYRVLRNHPVVLAQFATHFVEGQIRAPRMGWPPSRTGLGPTSILRCWRRPPRPGWSRPPGWLGPAARWA